MIAAASKRDEPVMTSETNMRSLKVVGTRPIRPDGVEKVTGRANFGADRTLPGMLHAKIKRSPYAHARIVRLTWTRRWHCPVFGRLRPLPTFRRSVCRGRPDELS